MQMTRLGTTDLLATPVCIGTSALGDMPGTYGYSVGIDRAMATVRAIFDGPINFLDVSRNYGLGQSEERIGRVIRERGGTPDGFVLSTKVDRDMDTMIFDAGQVRRSLNESLEALGLEKVEILHLHDPEYVADINQVTAPGGPLDELFKIKDEGLADYVGLAAGNVDVMLPLIESYEFDFMVTHNRFSIVNCSAEALINRAVARGTVVLNAAPYMGGVLAKGPDAYPRMTYMPAGPKKLEPVRELENLCRRHSIPLGAAALQYSIRDRRVGSTICGASRPERIAETVEWATLPIPDEFWAAAAQIERNAGDPEADREYVPD